MVIRLKIWKITQLWKVTESLKAWDAIARYMQSFDDTDGDGIANVPEYYAAIHGRKVVDDSKKYHRSCEASETSSLRSLS